MAEVEVEETGQYRALNFCSGLCRNETERGEWEREGGGERDGRGGTERVKEGGREEERGEARESAR